MMSFWISSNLLGFFSVFSPHHMHSNLWYVCAILRLEWMTVNNINSEKKNVRKYEKAVVRKSNPNADEIDSQKLKN